MRPLWLYLHFPNLQLDSLRSLQITKCSQPTELPLVILDSTCNRVVQLNRHAEQAGIRIQMSLGSAAALSQNLQVIPFNPRVEQDQLKYIAECLYLITSDICFFSSQGLLLRVHNMLRLYVDLETYWRVLKQRLTALGVTYQYATGQSPLAAKLLASTGLNLISEDSVELNQYVARVRIESGELTPKSVTKLASCGIRSIGELLDIPAQDLAQRFDAELITYRTQLKSGSKQALNFYHPDEKFSRYVELLYEIDNVARLIHPLAHLLAGLEQFLILRDALTHQLFITLYHRDKPAVEFELGAQQGEYLASRWLNLLSLRLEGLNLQEGVYAINLATGVTYIRAPDKGDLFCAKQGTLSPLQLVSLLQAKLGDKAISSPFVVDDLRPEVAAQFGPALSQHRPFISKQVLRPSFLLPSPEPLLEKVTILQGPERLDTGWWDNHPVVRDYFIARTSQGQWYWVFRTPAAQWYLHGVFS